MLSPKQGIWMSGKISGAEPGNLQFPTHSDFPAATKLPIIRLVGGVVFCLINQWVPGSSPGGNRLAEP